MSFMQLSFSRQVCQHSIACPGPGTSRTCALPAMVTLHQWLPIIDNVLQLSDNSIDDMPELPKNAKYIQHRNECFDWGTFGWAISTNKVDVGLYKFVIFLNSSVRGPFVPPYWPVSSNTRLHCQRHRQPDHCHPMQADREAKRNLMQAIHKAGLVGMCCCIMPEMCM